MIVPFCVVGVISESLRWDDEGSPLGLSWEPLKWTNPLDPGFLTIKCGNKKCYVINTLLFNKNLDKFSK